MASVNYNDKRFTQVESEKNVALKENDKLYDGMINSSDKYYQQQIDAVNKYGETQKQSQQELTDFAIQKIEQQKGYAEQDYLKEQSGAYVDWQKQSNQYGVNAERQAQNGLAFTGYSESSQVAMYNQYQNRVALARESFNRAMLDYDNMIKEARLQNNAKLAEIAYQTLQQTLELSLQGFQYKNTLLLDKANKKAEINDRYYTRYQNVLSQINTENALAEQVRQFNEQMAEEKRQFNETMAYNRARSFKSGGGGNSGNNNNAPQVKETEDTKKVKELTIDWKSVTALGYGPISESRLNELVASGKVIEIENEKTGVLTFKRATPSKTTAFKDKNNLLNANNLPKSVKKKLGLG